MLPTVEVYFEGTGTVPQALNHVFAYLAVDDAALVAPLSALRENPEATVGLLQSSYWNIFTENAPSKDALVFVAGQLESGVAVPFLVSAITSPMPEPVAPDDPDSHGEDPFGAEFKHRLMAMYALHSLAKAQVDTARLALRQVLSNGFLYDGLRTIAVVSLRDLGETEEDLTVWAGTDVSLLNVRTVLTEEEVAIELAIGALMDDAIGSEPLPTPPIIVEGNP